MILRLLATTLNPSTVDLASYITMHNPLYVHLPHFNSPPIDHISP